MLAAAPAIFSPWNDRHLFGRGDDPAPPELRAGRRRANVRAIAMAAALMIVAAGASAAWGMPLLLVLLPAADETAAIYAHEIAHFDRFTSCHGRRIQLLNRAPIISGVALALLAMQRQLSRREPSGPGRAPRGRDG